MKGNFMSKEKMTDQEVLDHIHEINLNMLLELDRIAKKYDVTYFLSCGGLLGALRHKDFIPWDNDVDVVMTRPEFKKLLPHLYEELDPELYEVIMPSDYGEKYFDMVPRINYKKAEIKMDPGYCEYYNGWANRIVIDFYFFDRLPDNFFGHMHIYRLEFLYGLLNGKRYDLDLNNYKGIMKAAAVVLCGIGKLFDAEKLRRHVDRVAQKYDHNDKVTTYRVTNDTIHTFTMSFPIEYYEKVRQVPIGKYTFPAPYKAEEVMTIHFGDYMKLPPEEERIPHWGFVPITADNFIFTDLD